MKEYFKNVPNVKYEGPKSNNPFAYKFYDADRVIHGKTMREQLKFAMSWWHTLCAGGNDPFGLSLIHILAYILCRLLRIPSKISTLIGVGSSICGGSAIAAAAPVINANDEEIAQSISVIFLFNIIAALIFPSMGQLLGLSNEGFALFAGTAVNDTSSVTAAASSWEEITGATGVLASATTVKLTRTLAIIPICLVLAVITAKKENISGHSVSLKKIFPMFIIWFVAASFITTFVPIPEAITDFLKGLSKFFIIMAMAAIGLNTNLVKLIKTGGKPILLGFCCWIAITAVSLTMQHLLGIF